MCGDTFVTGTEDCDTADKGGKTSDCTADCKNASCGDGEQNAGEACDDGNTTDGDGCQSDCSLPTCGDGVTDDGEECDDGNKSNDDGCSSKCLDETCGDGVVQSNEECDDGNANGAKGSGCTDSCMNDVCGDGHIGPSEACDDGNTVDGDDCTSRCGLPRCGNGVEEAGEECDDGNTNDRDGCLSSCVLAICGDGVVQAGVEECDDGNASGTDSCSNDCVAAFCGDGVVQQGEACDEGADNGAPGGTCTANCGSTTCGNGIVESGEQCDDGNTSDRDSCLTSCLWNSCGDGAIYSNVTDDANPNSVEECDDSNNDNSDTCTNACMAATCGDGFVGPGEACDEGADNGMAGGTCSADCALPTCGNGIVEAGEDCDDMNDDDTDSCAACHWNECGDGTPYLTATDPANTNALEECDDGNTTDTDTCTNACTTAVCGDMIVGPGEQCDDGNTVDGDGCNSCAGADCGNGVVDPGEDCDDGNQANNDACLNTCVWNSCGDSFAYLAANADANNPNPTEECDDGNGTNLDGCLNTCVANTCGDGFRNPATETCDDGALNGPGGTCSLLCTPSQCGNGTIDPGEECDDGGKMGNVAWDSCTSVCTWNKCGDGAVYAVVSNNSNPNPKEQCDDANDDNTDLCTTACKYNACGDTFLLDGVTGYKSEPYDDPDGTGPMTPSRGGFDDNGAMVPYWDVGMPTEIRPSDFAADSEECENPSPTGACVSSDFDGDGINECRNAKCGDGFVQAGVEECDENENTAAHTDNTDGCLDTCVLATCGDGWVRSDGMGADEVCDDGNTDNTDLCVNCNDPVCGDGIRQLNEGCDTGAARGPSPATCSLGCKINTCGDGVVQAANGEECDDGQNGNSDQCTDDCHWNVCGDTYTYSVTLPGPTGSEPLEECDDGNSNNRDGCTNVCADAECGDGFVEFNVEECDDGNNVNDDACTNDCNEPACGDGILQTGEACDDGGTCAGGIFAGQACDGSSDCVIDYTPCGDNSCSGGPNAGEGCNVEADCDLTGTCNAGATCAPDTGVVNAGGSCTAGSGVSCLHDCQGVCQGFDTGDDCGDTDDNDTGPGVACPAGLLCVTAVTGVPVDVAAGIDRGTCGTPCDSASDCGGVACTVELCRSGPNAGDACASDTECPGEPADCDRRCSGGLGATVECTTNGQCTDTTPTCSGGARCMGDSRSCNANRQCPGGACGGGGTCAGGSRNGLACNPDVDCANTAACEGQDADGCNDADPPTNGSQDEPLCAFSTCGDGILDLNEGCEVDADDNILVHGAAGPCPGAAGCPAAGVTCNVATCTLSSCGANAGTQTGEECDDGNASDTDNCTNRCRAARCGDGIVQGNEECDDGNPIETDNCTNACRWNVCGDGIRMDAAPSANSPAQVCDTGAVTTPAKPGGSPADYYMFTRGRDDGDGYDDQPAFCDAATCNIVCDGTNSVSASPWRSGNSCLMAAEEYPLEPIVPGTADNYLDDATYTPFELNRSDAEDYCDNLGIGAKLVKFENSTDRDTVSSLINAINDNDLWWVGAEENKSVPPTSPPTFVWLDGTAISGSLFEINEPSGPNGTCVVTDGGATPGGSLSDEPCGNNDTEEFFCEYDGPFPKSAVTP
jgi:cysteine-rich repeat protein